MVLRLVCVLVPTSAIGRADLRRGFLRLKSYITQHNAFTVKDAAQLAHLANKDLNDLIESIAHIH